MREVPRQKVAPTRGKGCTKEEAHQGGSAPTRSEKRTKVELLLNWALDMLCGQTPPNGARTQIRGVVKSWGGWRCPACGRNEQLARASLTGRSKGSAPNPKGVDHRQRDLRDDRQPVRHGRRPLGTYGQLRNVNYVTTRRRCSGRSSRSAVFRVSAFPFRAQRRARASLAGSFGRVFRGWRVGVFEERANSLHLKQFPGSSPLATSWQRLLRGSLGCGSWWC